MKSSDTVENYSTERNDRWVKALYKKYYKATLKIIEAGEF